MKITCLIMTIIFICCFSVIKAQQTDSIPPKKRDRYYSFTIGSNQLLSQKSNGTLQISFPYTITPIFGLSHDTIFTSSPISPFKQLKSIAIPINFEWGKLNHFYSFNIALHSSDWGGLVEFGYGRNYHLSLFGQHSTNANEKNIVIKPSINIGYNSYPPDDNFGSINNVNKSIQVLGYTSEPTFTKKVSTGRNTTKDVTYNTQSLNVSYIQQTFLLIPQINITNNPYKHKFHWEINVGYYFPLFEEAGVVLNKTAIGSSAQDQLHLYDLGTNGLNSTFNNKTINKSPFQFAGLKVGFAIGLNGIIHLNANKKYNQHPEIINKQLTHDGYYIDSLNNKNYCKINYHSNDTIVQIADSSLGFKPIKATDIKEFGFSTGDANNEITNKYFSVLINGKKIFLPVLVGGEHLKIFVQGRTKGVDYFYFKDDTLCERRKHETSKAWKKRFFSNYPLMAQMAYNNEFDELNGKENKLIFEEYDNWTNSFSKQLADTSMTLKGIIDANKYTRTNKIFWKNYLTWRILGIFGYFFDKKLSPKESDIRIHKPESNLNMNYLNAYKARAMTKLLKSMFIGRTWGLLAPPFFGI